MDTAILGRGVSMNGSSTRMGTPYHLAELLVAHRMITEKQLEIALDHHRKTGLRLGDALIQLRFVSEKDLGSLLEWLYLAEQRRTAMAPPVLEGPGPLERMAQAVGRAMARWRGGWVGELGMPHKLPSKARS